MQLISNATTPEQMRDEIANYLAAQAENFASQKNTTRSITKQEQLQAISHALLVIAEQIKSAVVTQNVREA